MSQQKNRGEKTWITKHLPIQPGRNVSLTSFFGSPLVAFRYWREHSSLGGYHLCIFVRDYDEWEDYSLKEKLDAKSELLDAFDFGVDEIRSVSEYETFQKWHQGMLFETALSEIEKLNEQLNRGRYWYDE